MPICPLSKRVEGVELWLQVQEKLHAMLVEQFSYPAEWLEARKAQVRFRHVLFGDADFQELAFLPSS